MWRLQRYGDVEITKMWRLHRCGDHGAVEIVEITQRDGDHRDVEWWRLQGGRYHRDVNVTEKQRPYTKQNHTTVPTIRVAE